MLVVVALEGCLGWRAVCVSGLFLLVGRVLFVSQMPFASQVLFASQSLLALQICVGVILGMDVFLSLSCCFGRNGGEYPWNRNNSAIYK